MTPTSIEGAEIPVVVMVAPFVPMNENAGGEGCRDTGEPKCNSDEIAAVKALANTVISFAVNDTDAEPPRTAYESSRR